MFSGTSRRKGRPRCCLDLLQAVSTAKTNGYCRFSPEMKNGRTIVTGWIDQLAAGNPQAAEQLWQHVTLRLQEFARQKLNSQTRRHHDEHDAANSAFHSLCRGLS